MPTYDYECDACSHTFELFQGINEPVKRRCPECRKNKLRRLFGTGGGILFKGSGFYQTDYRSESYRAAASKESGEKKPASKEKKNGASANSEAKKPAEQGSE